MKMQLKALIRGMFMETGCWSFQLLHPQLQSSSEWVTPAALGEALEGLLRGLSFE